MNLPIDCILMDAVKEIPGQREQGQYYMKFAKTM
jgi:hypothetical protein